MAEERVDRESGADAIVARESFNEEGSVEDIFGNCPPYEPPSARDAKDSDEAEEPRISHSDTEPSADKAGPRPRDGPAGLHLRATVAGPARGAARLTRLCSNIAYGQSPLRAG
jgi:hypothetical protein